MKNQIEEMAKEFTCIHEDDNCEYCEGRTSCMGLGIARKLYNAGYRKIPEGGCVLSKEENEMFCKFVSDECKKIRKETAEKIFLN